MKEIEIKGGELNDIKELHGLLRKKLNLPEYYGENLDSLWDLITGEIDLPVSILWSNYRKSEESLGEQASKYLALFEDADKEIDGFKFKTSL